MPIPFADNFDAFGRSQWVMLFNRRLVGPAFRLSSNEGQDGHLAGPEHRPAIILANQHELRHCISSGGMTAPDVYRARDDLGSPIRGAVSRG